MRKILLKNKLPVFIDKMNSTTVTIFVNINSGGALETDKERGYAHFLEHMVFEGTHTRNNFEIANAVEKLGGEINGFTSSERTCFYIKVPSKHAQVAIDILADIVCNASLLPELVEKEKQVILSEIDLYFDDPKLYKWVLFEKNIFSSNLKNFSLGTKESVSSATSESLEDFYQKNYVAENMFLVISGNPKNISLKPFEAVPKGSVSVDFKEKILSKSKRIVELGDISQSYTLTGFKTVSRKTYESVVLDVIHAILGRGASGKLFHEIRNKRGLGYAVVVAHVPTRFSGFFAIAVSTKKENIAQVEDIIKTEINNLKQISDVELEDAKEYLRGSIAMILENTRSRAEDIALWTGFASQNYLKEYLKSVDSVSKEDIIKVIDTFFKNNLVVNILQK